MIRYYFYIEPLIYSCSFCFFPHNYRVFSEVTSHSKSLVRAWEFCPWESPVHATSILVGIPVLALSLVSVQKTPLSLRTLISFSRPSLIMHDPSSAPNSCWAIWSLIIYTSLSSFWGTGIEVPIDLGSLKPSLISFYQVTEGNHWNPFTGPPEFKVSSLHLPFSSPYPK